MATIRFNVINKSNVAAAEFAVWDDMVSNPMSGGMLLPGFRWEFTNLLKPFKDTGIMQGSNLISDSGTLIATITGFNPRLPVSSTFSIKMQVGSKDILTCVVTQQTAQRSMTVAAGGSFKSPDHLIYKMQ